MYLKRLKDKINLKLRRSTIDEYVQVLWVLGVISIFMHGKIPFMLPASTISIMLSSILLLIKKEDIVELKKEGYSFVKLVWSYLLVSSIFIGIGIFYLSRNYLVFKESIYATYFLIVIFILFLMNLRGISFKSTSRLFTSGYLFFVLILTISFYYNLFDTGKWFGKSMGVKTDYNYLSYAFLSGFIVLIYISKNLNKFWQIALVSLGLISLAVPVLVSGSRRGIIALIVIHFILVVYFLIGLKKKRVNRNIGYYVLFLFLLMTTLHFSFKSKALRLYIVNNYSNLNSESIKSQYANVMYRYATITEKKPDFRNIYNDNWDFEPFRANGIIDKLIFQKEKIAIRKLMNKARYDEAFEKIGNLRFYSNSKENFLKSIPQEYREIKGIDSTRDSVFENLPYLFGIPYIEKDFLTIYKIENLLLVNKPENNNSSFQFITEDSTRRNTENITSYILLLPNTKGTITFNYSGIQTKNLNFSFQGVTTNKKVNYVEYDSIVQDSVFQKTITFETGDLTESLYYWSIKPLMQVKDTFNLSSFTYKRTPLDSKKSPSANIIEMNKYIASKKRRPYQLNILHQKYLLKSKKLLEIEEESLRDFINNFDSYKPKFEVYANSSIEILKSDSTWLFKELKNVKYPQVCAIVPVLSNGEYEMYLQVKSSKKPNILIKRYPETAPHFLNKNVEKKKIVLYEKDIYRINFQFKVSESASALAYIIISIPKSETEGKFEISNVKYRILNLNDTIVTRFQYTFISELFNKIEKETNFELATNQNDRYLYFKKSISKKNSLLDERTERWRFAVYYFNQYSVFHKLFGKGFEYLKIYPIVFEEKGIDQEYDYPHNPIISAFLYSGILGGLFYIYFLGLSFYKYWKQRKELALFGLLYSLAFAFTFFSGNSHFSVPSFTFLSLLPFAFKTKKSLIKNTNQLHNKTD